MDLAVIMSIYNGASSLERAMQSLYNQTFRHWVLYVVDDGSKDKTPQMLLEYAHEKSNIKVITNDRNYGLAYSLNRAINEISSRYIARMDVDDYSLPDRLKLQYEFMCAHQDIDVLGTGIVGIDVWGNPLGVAIRPENHLELSKRMYKETPFFHPTVMMKRSFLIESGGYDPKIRYGQDSDLWLRTYKTHRFHNLAEPLLQYTLQSNISFNRTLWGTYILICNAHRERLLWSKGWYALRFFIASILTWFKLRSPGVKFTGSNSLSVSKIS